MLYVLIILIAITLIILATTLCYARIDIHLKNNILNVTIGNKVWKKHYKIDFSEQENSTTESKTKFDKKSSIKEKISSIKNRIFNFEKGFDIDEVAKIKDEITETYSSVTGIIKDILGHLRYKIQIPVLKIELEYGTGDAASTGMIYGSIWSVTSLIYPIISMWTHMVYPTLDITPDYYGKRFDIEAWSIIKVRPAHIINAAIKTFFSPNLTYLKNIFKKGRVENGR